MTRRHAGKAAPPSGFDKIYERIYHQISLKKKNEIIRYGAHVTIWKPQWIKENQNKIYYWNIEYHFIPKKCLILF